MAGPLQLVAIEFDADDRSHAQIHAELDAVRGRGVIKLIDLIFVHKDMHGVVSERLESAAEPDDQPHGHSGEALRRMVVPNGAVSGVLAEPPPEQRTFGLEEADIKALTAQLPNGSGAALALFEHTWATGLSQAVRDAGGRMVAQGILTREAVLMIGREVEAIANAQERIALAEAVSHKALLDALGFAAVVEQATETGGGRLRTIVAAEALRALMDAGIVHTDDGQAALAALVEADLIELDALQQAIAETAASA